MCPNGKTSSNETTSPNVAAILNDFFASSASLFLRMRYAETPTTINAPAINDASTVCSRRGNVDGLNTAAPKSVNSARPFCTTYPAGVCCHEFATRIQNAEIVAPTATIRTENQCIPLETFSRPNKYKPRKPDSRKNANRPSAASGAPKISPTNFEYCAQLVPNWNSMTTPVATPTAKVSARILPKNFPMRTYELSFFLHPIHSKITSNQPRPIESGGKKK